MDGQTDGIAVVCIHQVNHVNFRNGCGHDNRTMIIDVGLISTVISGNQTCVTRGKVHHIND